MKQWKVGLFLAVVAIFVTVSFHQVLRSAEAACNWSPNYSSQQGQCTWYADGKAAVNGWPLTFAGKKGDAYNWYSKGYIKNAGQNSSGKSGYIMVFGSGNDSNGKDYSSGHHGHVAYVTSSGKWNGQSAWTVRQANWYNPKIKGSDFGQWIVPDEKPCGQTVTQCTFVEYKSGWVKIQNGNSLGATGYPLLGFIYKK